MSVRKRGKSWLVDVKVGGERIRRTVGTGKQDAQRAEAEIRQQLLSERVPDYGLDAALLKYLTEYVPHLKDERGQKNKAKQLRPILSGKLFADVPAVVGVIKALPLASATINRRLALLRRLCNLAWKEWGWIQKPVHISLLQERNQRHVYLSIEQVEKIAGFCSEGAADGIRFAAYTGLRRGELFGISESNVMDGCLVLDTNNKTGRPRIIPLHDAIKDIKLPLRTTDALLRTEWEAARKKAKLSHVRFHDLRHTLASWLVQSGVPLFTVGEILGHSVTQTTKRYSHLRRDDLRAAISLIGAQRGAQVNEHKP